MRLREYLSARDQCFKAEVYVSLRASGMSDVRADAIVEEAFIRAAATLEKVTAARLKEAIDRIELPSPREEHAHASD